MRPVQPTPRPLGLGTLILRPMAFVLKACYTQGSAVVVTNSEGEYLLVRQNTREHGRWGFPGGFLDRGELPAEGARRELHEETGIDRPSDEFTYLFSYKQPWAWHYEHVYALELFDDGATVVKSRLHRWWHLGRFFREIRSIEWFSERNPPPRGITAAANEILARLQQPTSEPGMISDITNA